MRLTHLLNTFLMIKKVQDLNLRLSRLEVLHNKLTDLEDNDYVSTELINELIRIAEGIMSISLPSKVRKNDKIKDSSLRYNLRDVYFKFLPTVNVMHTLMLHGLGNKFEKKTVSTIIRKSLHNSNTIMDFVDSSFCMIDEDTELYRVVTVKDLKQSVELLVSIMETVHLKKELKETYDYIYNSQERNVLLSNISSKLKSLTDKELLELYESIK